MDNERIYCVEQIRIPPELPTILREWSKAVLDTQPQNIIEFSSKYFAQKAAIAASNYAASRFCPELKQIKQVYDGLNEATNEKEVESVMSNAGIPAQVIDAILKIASTEELTRCNVTTLLTSLASEAPIDVIRLFLATGAGDESGSMKPTASPELIASLLKSLEKFDPRITTDILDEALREVGRWEPNQPVTYEFIERGVLSSLLRP